MKHGSKVWIDYRSIYRGLKVMKDPMLLFDFRYWSIRFNKRFWCQIWIPSWNKGRGPYITIGLGIIAICRGY